MPNEIDFVKLFELYPLSCKWLCYKLENNGRKFRDYNNWSTEKINKTITMYAMDIGKLYDFFAEEDIFLNVLPCTFGYNVVCNSIYRKTIVKELEKQEKAYELSIENGFMLLEEQINITKKLYM